MKKNTDGFPVVHREIKGGASVAYLRFDAVCKAFNLQERGLLNDENNLTQE